MIVCIPVTPDGQVDRSWGRAARVAVAHITNEGIESWEEFDVAWDRLHDIGPEGGHHARVARFLSEHAVQLVVAEHVGPPMQQMLMKLGIGLRLGASGDARRAARISRT